ncbi:alpha/beta hydrolase [Bradyrhizobium sp. ISRA435]|nr:alpha/beta hydrolase [Bradyrhizobium sp. ISRA435]
MAGSGSTDHDGNGPQLKPATLKKLSEQLVARGIATLRYDKRGAGGWKKEFGRPENFRFKDFVDDAVSLIEYLRASGRFARIAVVGHSEGGLVALLAVQRAPIDRLVLLATAARKQGDLLKAQLESSCRRTNTRRSARRSTTSWPDRSSTRRRRGLAIAPSMQPGMASAFNEDPIEPMKKVTGPTLIVAGGRDHQLARLDLLALTAADIAAKSLWLPDMNHVLVDVTDEADDVASYNQPDRALDPAMIDAVAAFISHE